MSGKTSNIDVIQSICNSSQQAMDDYVESDGRMSGTRNDVSIPCSTQNLKPFQDNSSDCEGDEARETCEKDSIRNNQEELDGSEPFDYFHPVDDEVDSYRTYSEESDSADSLSFPDYDDFYSDTDSREPIDENEDIFLHGRGCYPFFPLEIETWEVPKDDPYREFYGYSAPEKLLTLGQKDHQGEGDISACVADDTYTPKENESLLPLPENQPSVINFAQPIEARSKEGERDILDESCRDKAIQATNHESESDKNTKVVPLNERVELEEKEDEFRTRDSSIILADLVQPIDELHLSTAKLDSEPHMQKSPKKQSLIEDGIHEPRTGVSISFEKKDTP